MSESKMKILVGVPTAEKPRHHEFWDAYNMLERPVGTVCMFAHGQSPAKNRNDIIQKALDHECSHILFLDDDMVFEPDTLIKLLANADKDVVTGLYLMRNYPHFPVAFDERYEDGKCRHYPMKPEVNGLREIVNCGFGCVLIRTEVFKKLDSPWVTLGGIHKDEWCDDIVFFNRVVDAGFKMYCDFNVRVGHKLEVGLYPDKADDGKWLVKYVTATGQAISIPQFVPSDDDLIKIKELTYGKSGKVE